MPNCYFLLDKVVNSPYIGLSFGSIDNNVHSLDHLFGHFDGFSYNNFYHINQYKLTNPYKIKFVLTYTHMPLNTNIDLSRDAIDIINNDDKTFLCIFSVLESKITPVELSTELQRQGIPLNKVVVVCSNLESHNKIIEGVKYICINFWESISRHHHKTLPDMAITMPDELNLQNASKKFICLNRNIKPHRIWLMYSLLQSKIIDQGHVSYHLPSISKEDHIRCAKEHAIRRIPKELHEDFKYALMRNMYTRMLDDLHKHVINYGNSIKYYYNDSLLSVITESDTHDNFITEKTYKAMMNLHPFFIVGNPAQHTLLRKRGYHTFEDLFEVNDVGHYTTAMKLWKNIKKKDIGLLKQDIEKKYMDKLIHNQQLFLSRSAKWDNIVDTIIETIS